MSRVGVVVPAWNSLAYLEPCLRSIEAQDEPVDVVVVDNGSTDGTVEWLAARPHIRTLCFPVNRGFAVAVNAGALLTAAPYVLVLNADATLGPACSRRLADALDERPGLAGVQPKIAQAGVPGARLYSVGQRLLADGRAVEDGAGASDGPRFAVPRDVFGVCGAACLLRRELFTDLGGYDERFFAFHEDVDLNARARLAGWDFAYLPAADAAHHGNAIWQSAAPAPQQFNVHLVARNRLATDLRLMPARNAPRILLAEVGSLVRSGRRGTLRSALRGKFEALRWSPQLLRERRALLVDGRASRLEPWLDRDRGWLRRHAG